MKDGCKKGKGNAGRFHGPQNARTREPLPTGNSAEAQVTSISTGEGWAEVTVRGNDFAAMAQAVARMATVKTSDMDEVFAVVTSPDQAEVPMTDTPDAKPKVQQLLNDTLTTGTHLALANALKVMGPQLGAQGSEGWAVVVGRAERFVRTMAMHVTRFLQQPDCRVRHASVDDDLLVAHVDVSDVGRVQLGCTNLDGGGWRTFELEELVSAGPVNDMVRAMVTQLSQTMVRDFLGQMIEQGKLPGIEAYSRMTGGEAYNEQDREDIDADRLHVATDPARPGGDMTAEVTASRDEDGNVTIHHLQVRDDTVGDVAFIRNPEHPERLPEVHHLRVYSEYVLGEDGPHAEPRDYVPSDSAWQPPEEARCDYCGKPISEGHAMDCARPLAVGFEPPAGDDAFGENGS